MSKPLFPNLFIIGAMKAGTSSLHEYLHQHPQIFMSRFKEPQYFHPHRTAYGDWGQGNPLPEPGIDWYLRLFKDAGDVCYAGESSTSYAKTPIVTGCANRIAEFNRNAKIVYLLREPVERTLSHYWYYAAGGSESRDLATAIEQDVQYTAYSNYAMQIEPYLHVFGEDNVYTLTVEELNSDPIATFGKLFRWLGINDAFVPSMSKRENVTPHIVHRLRPGFRWAGSLRRHWRWKALEQRTPVLLKQATSWLAYERLDRRNVDASKVVDKLRARQLNEVARLTSLTGRSFPEWLQSRVPSSRSKLVEAMQ
jgi:hypothetical protein